jgi:hypothetical protein
MSIKKEKISGLSTEMNHDYQDFIFTDNSYSRPGLHQIHLPKNYLKVDDSFRTYKNNYNSPEIMVIIKVLTIYLKF